MMLGGFGLVGGAMRSHCGSAITFARVFPQRKRGAPSGQALRRLCISCDKEPSTRADRAASGLLYR